MKVAFVSPSLSRDAGGIFEIERDLAKALHSSTPAQIDVLGLRDEHTEKDRLEWAPLKPQVFGTTGPDAFRYAPRLLEGMHTSNADLVHLHALWMYTSVATLRWSRRTGRPHVVTINGMLDDWALQNARWKKRIAGVLYEDTNLQAAACLHVNTDAERQAVRRYGVGGPVCIIPNGVTLPDSTARESPPWAGVIPSDSNVLLYLGRIHPKKGLQELIDGWKEWKQAQVDDAWHIAVVGWEDGDHEKNLRERVRTAGVEDSVHFLGPMFEEEKASAFTHADAFVLPSHSEGFPMAVLEAWSYALPVLKTPACNIPAGFEADAAVQIDPRPRSIAEGLDQLLGASDEARTAMGERGRKLVEDRYTWSHAAEQMHRVYQWLLGDAEQPDSVELD
ncbi:poly(glycerol-phosphate) alpha-glucosyltransferase [Salinibacter ruber]|uniref:Poly(Glycerol-phosphate) alpha-glucosyltransferase n=1 Tax=Salinibacter ruber TaxID=146919 RepID=A0A9X2Q1I6_9BACT|nr:glycosyltransferase [Salinibacter ruber]MCS3678759.1 poly(glycerol-phosphate) alpha-glucosyltransferase [Salinibacter ruber]MCS3682324.1 poly(glycerol-phosphate) alpha-glucosyltransferase [Salinibacter ruber]